MERQYDGFPYRPLKRYVPPRSPARSRRGPCAPTEWEFGAAQMDETCAASLCYKAS